MQDKMVSKNEGMERLAHEIINCRKCDLWKTRNKPLVGDGFISSDMMIIGESPGYNEDIMGRAFVGEAGKVLDQLLDIIGLKRGDVYITNILKCHPPRNHNPNRKEIDSCIGYLYKQIDIIRPKIIITLGKFASREIFHKYDLPFTKISEIKGRPFEAKASYGSIKILPLYHPAVACYHAEMIDVLKEDIAKVKDCLCSSSDS